jgi:hypothetical protein
MHNTPHNTAADEWNVSMKQWYDDTARENL